MAKDLSGKIPQADYATKATNLRDKLRRHREKMAYMKQREAEIAAAIELCEQKLAQGKVGPDQEAEATPSA